MSIAARTLKDGTTVYDVTVYTGFTRDGKRDRRKVTCKTKSVARREEARLIAERDMRNGRSGRMTLSAYVADVYWPLASARLAATSKDTYEKELRLRILPALGRLDMRDIDRVRIQKMVDAIPTESVARKCVGVLKTVLNEAKGDGYLASNPADARFAMPPKGKKRDSGAVLASFAEIEGFVAEIDDDCLMRIALTGFYQGLRPEERYALDWDDLDVDSGTMRVHRAYVTASPRSGGRQMKGTKTQWSERVLPLHPALSSYLADGERGKGPFLTGADGRRLSPSTAQKRWTRFLDAHPGLPRVTIENMRHSFATSYLAAGGRIETLSRILGHSDINTTLRKYVRPDFESLRLEIEHIANT